MNKILAVLVGLLTSVLLAQQDGLSRFAGELLSIADAEEVMAWGQRLVMGAGIAAMMIVFATFKGWKLVKNGKPKEGNPMPAPVPDRRDNGEVLDKLAGIDSLLKRMDVQVTANVEHSGRIAERIERIAKSLSTHIKQPMDVAHKLQA